MPTVALIAGSPSERSRSAAVLEYIAHRLVEAGMTPAAIKVRDLDPTELLHADWNGASVKAAIETVMNADAVIIGTPIYKAAYSGVLKAFLDMLPQKGFENKAVLPIATGGSPAHMLAVDYALKPVLAALGVQHSLKTIYIVDAQVEYANGHGVRFVDEDVEARVQTGVQHLIQLIQQTDLLVKDN